MTPRVSNAAGAPNENSLGDQAGARLVRLYEAWDKPVEAEEWRAIQG